MADNSPYFMFGLSAQYPVTPNVELGLFVINGYSYLSSPNDAPSYGTRLDWKPTDELRVIQNLYYGPDQSQTDVRFWRFFSDSIVEWQHDRITLGAAYDIGTEAAAELPGHPRTFWTSAAVFGAWKVSGPWTLSLRPELYWDRNARLTGSEQLLKAVTSTVDYRIRRTAHTGILRLEYRYDESTGRQGGFFKDGELVSGVPGLTREQHLILLSVVWAFDR